MIGSASKEEESFAQANQTASEAFTNIRTIAAFGMEGQVRAGGYHQCAAPHQLAGTAA